MATLRQFEVIVALKPDHVTIYPREPSYVLKPGMACHIHALLCEAQQTSCACLVLQNERHLSDSKMRIGPDFQNSRGLYDLKAIRTGSPMVGTVKAN